MFSDDVSDFHSARRRPGQSYELSSACLAHLCVVCIQLLNFIIIFVTTHISVISTGSSAGIAERPRFL